jgi:hypothetical protein
MAKKFSKQKKKFVAVKKIFVFVVVVILLYLFGIGTLFIPAIQNLRENPCTRVPLLTDWGVIPQCSPTQTCLGDNYCTWTLEVVDNKCNFSAVNIYEQRCNDAELSEYTRYLGTDLAQKEGWKSEVEVCYELTHVAKDYKASYWWNGVDYCPSEVSTVEAYCKKTEFDIYSKGLGQCAVRFE